MVGEAHQAGPDLQRRAEVRAVGPCPEKTKMGCYPGVEPRCDAQPVPDRRAIHRSNLAVAEVRPVSHRHHPGEASASAGPGLGRPGGWFGRRLATGLLAVHRDRAVHPCGQGAPDVAGQGAPDVAERPEAAATRRSAAQQAEWRSNHRSG
jgi:hypothetical protein